MKGHKLVGIVLGMVALLPILVATASSENRLGLDHLTKQQRLQLWERVERAGSFEAVARFCGKNTLIDRRVTEAVKSCVTEAALGAAKAHFWHGFRRDTMPPKRNQAAFCGDSEIKSIISRHVKLADKEVAEATRLCQRCLATGLCG
jgi:hypothetical protein